MYSCAANNVDIDVSKISELNVTPLLYRDGNRDNNSESSRDNSTGEPAAYWSAPREHLSATPGVQQQQQIEIHYRGLPPRTLENAYAHQDNGDSFRMLVEIAVASPYEPPRQRPPSAS